MKDQLSGQLKMFIISYTTEQWTYNIDLLHPGYYVPLNLNFVQYFWLILANIFCFFLKSLHRISQT